MSHDRGCFCGKERYEYDDCHKKERHVEQTEADTKQVGGTHYEQEYQHWDWVVDTDQGYLIGNCSKYVTRWRKKNGLEDLLKARTYLAKRNSADDAGRKISGDQMKKYRAANKRFLVGFDGAEREFLEELTFWETHADLGRLMTVLDAIIQTAQTAAGGRGGAGLG